MASDVLVFSAQSTVCSARRMFSVCCQQNNLNFNGLRQTSKRFVTPYEIDIVKSLSVSSRGSSCSCARASGWSRSSTRCSTFSGTRSRSRGFLTMILRQFVFACGSRWATLCTRGSVEDNSPFSGRERTSWHFTVMQDYKFSFRSTPSTLSTLNSQLFFVSGEVRT